jgi:hypothetical protein
VKKENAAKEIGHRVRLKERLRKNQRKKGEKLNRP